MARENDRLARKEPKQYSNGVLPWAEMPIFLLPIITLCVYNRLTQESA